MRRRGQAPRSNLAPVISAIEIASSLSLLAMTRGTVSTYFLLGRKLPLSQLYFTSTPIVNLERRFQTEECRQGLMALDLGSWKVSRDGGGSGKRDRGHEPKESDRPYLVDDDGTHLGPSIRRPSARTKCGNAHLAKPYPSSASLERNIATTAWTEDRRTPSASLHLALRRAPEEKPLPFARAAAPADPAP